MYGSSFWSVTRRPRLFSSRPSDDAVSPLPRLDATPPVTKTCLANAHAPSEDADTATATVAPACAIFGDQRGRRQRSDRRGAERGVDPEIEDDSAATGGERSVESTQKFSSRSAAEL